MSALKPGIRASAALLMLFGVVGGCFFSAGTPPPLADGGGGSSPTGSGSAGGGAGGGGGSVGNGGAGGGMAVMVPELGAQVDRMGRPAINMMLNQTFNPDAGIQDAARDAWNHTPMDQWMAFIPEIARNLGILDSFDATCGNQRFADNNAGANRYMVLAGILADDRLWVKLNGGFCTGYLNVELGQSGCGGRRLYSDVVDVSYRELATGGFPYVTDGIAADPVKTDGTTFPYLADPLP